MKKLISFFSVFVLILNVLSVFSLADSTPKVYLEDAIKYDNKENVTVSIYMQDTNPNIVTLGLDLKYDTSKLEYVSSKAGKDLSATLKLDENIPEESRVAIAIISVTGLKKDGLYYQVNFKVKDTSKDIPLELSLREATDSKGNDIKVETTGGKVKISSEEVKQEEKNTTQKIENFEVNNVEDLTSIEDIITQSASIEVGTEDIITYEVEDTSVAEILNDGTIIPNQNGTSKVRVKMNGQYIGTVEVTVKDGIVEKVTGKEEVAEFTAMNSQLVSNSTSEKSNFENSLVNSSTNNSENQENRELENEKQFNIIPVIIIVIIILIFILIIRKKRRKK